MRAGERGRGGDRQERQAGAGEAAEIARAVDRHLERGDAWMALSIPNRYGESVAAGRPVTLQVLADGGVRAVGMCG